MFELMKQLGLCLLIGFVPWIGLSALVSRVFKANFTAVYMFVGLIYIVVLFGLALKVTPS
jgi:hypothetical protein